jgi:hypothetical protein
MHKLAKFSLQYFIPLNSQGLFANTYLHPAIHSVGATVTQLLFIIFSGSAAQRGLWPPRSRGFLITHKDAPQSVGLLCTSDHLVAEIST